MKPLSLHAPARDATPAFKLAAALGLSLEPVSWHRFPDGESLVSLSAAPGRTALFYWNLYQPDQNLFAALQAGDAARRAGAARVVLVAPYLPYLRQDEAFAPGQPVSAQLMGKLLAQVFDLVCTVDPHLHRTPSLDALLGEGRGLAVSASPVLRGFLLGQCPDALLLGPDEESRQWVEGTAGDDFPWQIADKVRHGDLEVRVTLSAPEALRGRHVVIVDDIASSGCTVARCAEAALAAGASRVSCAVTHGLFAGEALQTIRASGVSMIWSTDSVPHNTNAASLAMSLAAALRGWCVSG